MKTLDKAIKVLDVKYPENAKQAMSFKQKLEAAAKQVKQAADRIEKDKKKITDIYKEFSRVMNYTGRETIDLLDSVGLSWQLWEDMQHAMQEIE